MTKIQALNSVPYAHIMGLHLMQLLSIIKINNYKKQLSISTILIKKMLRKNLREIKK